MLDVRQGPCSESGSTNCEMLLPELGCSSEFNS